MSGKNKRVRRQGRGVILMLASLLAASAGVRVASSAGDALPLLPERLSAPPAAEVAPLPRAKEAGRAEMASLLEALRVREAAVEQREADMAVREKSLSVARKEIERRMVALKETEAQLRATLSRADTAAEDDVARLTTVYENMKPKEAAALFEAMEPEFAAGFLGRMRPDAAASIMAGLSPEVAYTISVILAGRNAGAPKD
ncbi:MAG: hypothetical protein AAFY38_15210 [Pseudomonadota bacterium]